MPAHPQARHLRLSAKSESTPSFSAATAVHLTPRRGVHTRKPSWRTARPQSSPSLRSADGILPHQLAPCGFGVAQRRQRNQGAGNVPSRLLLLLLAAQTHSTNAVQRRIGGGSGVKRTRILALTDRARRVSMASGFRCCGPVSPPMPSSSNRQFHLSWAEARARTHAHQKAYQSPGGFAISVLRRAALPSPALHCTALHSTWLPATAVCCALCGLSPSIREHRDLVRENRRG